MTIIDKSTIIAKPSEFADLLRMARLSNAKEDQDCRIVLDEGYLSLEKINGFKAYQKSKYKPGQRPPSDDEQPCDIINH